MQIQSYEGMLYIQSYQDQSTEEMETQDLKTLCIKRIKAYQKVNQLFAQNDLSEAIKDQQKQVASINPKAVKIYNEYECFGGGDEFWIKDNAAHFFLQLAYSESDERINEFVKFQKQLFQIRLEQVLENDESHDRLFKMCQLLFENNNIERVTKQEWDEISIQKNILGQQIILGTGKAQLRQFNNQKVYYNFFKTPFQNVLQAVSSLHTYIKNGYAYIYYDELEKCILDVFIRKLRKRMQTIQNSYSYEQLKNNDMLMKIFQEIRQVDSGVLTNKQLNFEQDSLNSQTVRQQSRDHFPLCMEFLIDKLESNHHLKHSGRQQIQLFFKSAGMKMNETIQYMRMQFQQKISEQDFDKAYLYNIRHNYGQEGKRENYQCHTCTYIIKQNPGNDEYHGCPIKNFNSQALEKYLLLKKYEETDIKKIIELKQGNHIQLACTQIWNLKNKNSQNNIIIDNPIVFYKESLIHHKKIQLKIEQEEPADK